MCQTAVSVFFVCKLCQGFFQQVADFIEHKKEQHFTQFQKTSCIVFEERESNILTSVITSEDPQLTTETKEPPAKMEVNDADPSIPFGSEIIDEPNLDLIEPKSELISCEGEINPESENNFFGLKQQERNPYVLLTRLTSKELQRASVPQDHSTLLKCGQKILQNSSDLPNLCDIDSTVIDNTDVEQSTDIQPATTIMNSSTAHALHFECKLCSKQLPSDAQLRIHVGICVLYHKDRNRYCVTCNKKLSHPWSLKHHRMRYHGTEEEKASLFKLKCHLCPKVYRMALDLRFHLETHNEKKQQIKTSKSKPFKCLQPNCGKEFNSNSYLQRHTATHLGLRAFSCKNCNKNYGRREHLEVHMRSHTGDRPYKCTVDNCNKTFICSSQRSRHYRTAHSN